RALRPGGIRGQLAAGQPVAGRRARADRGAVLQRRLLAAPPHGSERLQLPPARPGHAGGTRRRHADADQRRPRLFARGRAGLYPSSRRWPAAARQLFLQRGHRSGFPAAGQRAARDRAGLGGLAAGTDPGPGHARPTRRPACHPGRHGGCPYRGRRAPGLGARRLTGVAGDGSAQPAGRALHRPGRARVRPGLGAAPRTRVQARGDMALLARPARMRWRRGAGGAGLAGVMALAAAGPGHAQVDEYALKAAFVYNIAAFAQWRGAPEGVLTLCVQAGPELDAAVAAMAGRSLAGRRVEVTRTPPAGGCDVLVRDAHPADAVDVEAEVDARLVICDACELPDGSSTVAL